MKKILLCDGDSWTAGDIVDPDIFGDQLEHVNHPDNRPYRLPKVWPHKLAKLLEVEVENTSVAASSNDAIVRRIVENVLDILNIKMNKLLNPFSPDTFLKGIKM